MRCAMHGRCNISEHHVTLILVSVPAWHRLVLQWQSAAVTLSPGPTLRNLTVGMTARALGL